MTKWVLVIGMTAVALAETATEAHAYVAVGINFGGPYYRPGPCYAPYYYRPYAVYVAPPPVYYAPPPVVYQPAPVVVQQAVPVVQPVVTRSPSASEPPVGWTADPKSGDVNRHMQQLFDHDEHVRCEAAMDLGRQRCDRAVEPLSTLLSTDRSPLVRETAARALGLIGASRSLGALQNAAQADPDRDVRHSAQFAAEVIRGNLRKD